MPAVATTDHGYVFGAYEFWKKAQKPASSRSSASRPTSRPGTHRTRQDPGQVGATAARDDVSGSGAYTHMTLLAREQPTACTTCSGMSLAGLARGLLLQAAHGPRAAADLRRGPHRHHRLRRRARCRPGSGSASTSEAVEAAAEFRDIFGTENFFCRDHGPRPRHRAPRPCRTCCGSPRTSACRWSRPTTCTTRTRRGRQGARGAALRAVRLDPRSTRTGSSSTPTSSTSRPPQQMRHLFRELPEACDNTLLIAERCEVVLHRGRGPLHAALPLPEGENETLLVRQGGRDAACTSATRTASRTTRPQAGRVRDRGHRRQGLPRLLPRRRRLHQLGQGATASGSAPAAAPAPARWPPTPCGSPTSTRSSTA